MKKLAKSLISVAIAATMFLSGCGVNNASNNTSQQTTVLTSAQIESETLASSTISTSTSTSAIITTTETQKAISPIITTTKPTVQLTQPDSKSVTVYKTKWGHKYHRLGCRYLKKSCIPISLEDAKKECTPCSVCNPPT